MLKGIFILLLVNIFIQSVFVYLVTASCFGLSTETRPVSLEGLGPPHVHYVDQQKTSSGVTNYLFRGGNPDITKDYSMNFDGLVKQIALAAKDARVTLPSDFYLVDINLLNLDPMVYSSKKDIMGWDLQHFLGEITYFLANPLKGEIIFWESMGTWDNATLLKSKGKQIFDYLIQTLPAWQGDQLIQRMETLGSYLRKDWGKPAIIYGHCDCGCDRTGQLFGSYYMRWMNMTWDHVNVLNTKIATRPMECQNYFNMQWYCLWLRDVQNYKHLTCEKNHPCTKHESPHPAVVEKTNAS